MGNPPEAEFDGFVAARSPALYRSALLMCGGDAAAAADAVQDCMVDLWRRWSRVRTMERADGYAYRVLVTNVLRGRRKTLHLVATYDVPEQPAVDAIASADDRRDFTALLRRLPPMQRAVVVLRYYEDMTEAQVADVLNISIGTVKSHGSRALASLRQLLPQEKASG